MSKILFSPLGKTDPISNMRDGSMLHICRIYKPDKVVLYMSREILKDHQSDNRYVYCLERLGEKLNHHFEIQIIEKPELVDVHKLDDFYDEFNRYLQKIEITDQDEILLNVSSGTPAMKMTLQVLASLYPERYKAVQVETPAKGANKAHEDTDHYDVALQWEYNLDNQEDELEDRSSFSKTSSLFLHIQKENIKHLVKEYDYSAALEMAEGMQEVLSQKAFLYLKAAEKRNLLDIPGVQSLLGKDTKKFMPDIKENDCNIIEYLLNLKVKLLKKQYADYIRAITPVILDVFLSYLKNKFQITESMFCKRKKSGVWCLDNRTMLERAPWMFEIFKNAFTGGVDGKFLSSIHVKEIILYKETDEEVKDIVKKLRNVEEKVRNYAAHDIVSITAETIRRDTSMSAERIYSLLENLAERSGIQLKKTYKNSYEQMNEMIIQEIDVQC